jgi:hypothetical protein
LKKSNLSVGVQNPSVIVRWLRAYSLSWGKKLSLEISCAVIPKGEAASYYTKIKIDAPKGLDAACGCCRVESYASSLESKWWRREFLACECWV